MGNIVFLIAGLLVIVLGNQFNTNKNILRSASTLIGIFILITDLCIPL
jgi:NADH:ubiquinone oxidoreductase subunit 6 (subunit J)